MDIMASHLQLVFGQRVREERERIGMTQAELARRCRIHQPTLCDLEKGRHAATLETVEKIAIVLRVPSVALLTCDAVTA